MIDIIILVFLILFISAIINCISYLFRKITKKDCEKQKKRIKKQIIALFLLIVLFHICNFREQEKQDKAEAVQQNETGSNITNSTATPIPTIIVESEEEYKASCKEYNYKDVLRNPENYIGERVKIIIEVSSVHESSWLNDTKYYFGYSEGDYGYYIGDRYGVFDKREDGSFKILSKDIIAVYGEIISPEYTSSIILSSEEIFCIDMKYAELIQE